MLSLAVATASILAMPPDAPRSPDWKPVAASLVVPGSGQYLQGRTGRAATQLGAALACLAVYVAADRQPASAVGGPDNVRTFAAAGMLGLAVWSPLDAWLFERTSVATEEVAR